MEYKLDETMKYEFENGSIEVINNGEKFLINYESKAEYNCIKGDTFYYNWITSINTSFEEKIIVMVSYPEEGYEHTTGGKKSKKMVSAHFIKYEGEDYTGLCKIISDGINKSVRENTNMNVDNRRY